ncbi:taste receptor type 2 member 40-like [Dendropsophus ebraccatus]|uniref:taste receptor type 2 member 40-like n=1 Tax=Dendropsophus ebraccatus TaxID=150705 RepID=UPI0038316E57
MDAVQNTLIAISYVTLILSLPGNFFIIAVNTGEVCRNRRLALSDWLIVGFSVFCFLHGLHECYIMYMDLFLFYRNDLQIFMYLNMCSLWFSALLSIHYCLKIVTIHHWFYSHLQRRFPQLFPWIHLAFSFVHSFLTVCSALDTKPECHQVNTTESKVISLKTPVRCYWIILLFQIICLLCTFLCSVSASTILISLCKHMKRIQENSEGSGSPNIEAHIHAATTVSTLLVTNILIFTSVTILTLSDDFWVYLFGILLSLCHIFSSYFLIKGTKRLNKTLTKILNWCS